MSSVVFALLLTGYFSSADVGTTALPLLRISTGPRAGAMGECFTALSDDATAIYWNPSGLGRSRDPEFYLSHHEWFLGFRDEYASAALPFGPGRLGLGLTFSGVSGIESWDGNNLPRSVPTVANYTGVFTAGYGVQVGTPRTPMFLGGAIKGVYDYLGDASYSGTAAGVDLGFIASPLPSLSLGLSANNLGAAAYTNNPYYYWLPANLKVGALFRYRDLSLVSDFVLPIDNDPSLHLGGEYTIFKVVSVRAGYKTGPQHISSLGLLSGLCLGAGFRIGRLNIDYAFEPYGMLGSTHRVGLRAVVPPRGFGTLRIRVVDGKNSEPLAADLQVSGIREGQMTANRMGRVELTRMGEGWVKVRASYPGYVPQVESVLSYGDREQDLTLALGRPGRGTIWGRLLDAVDKRPLSGFVSYYGRARGELSVDSVQASFAVKNLQAGSYILRANGPTPDYFPQICTLDVEADRVTNKDFLLVRKFQKIILRGVNFETGFADLRPQDLPSLDEAGKILFENPGINVELGGHTDPREINTQQFPSNWELSKARAEAVRDYLVKKFGIRPERLIARGYADTQPIVPNDSPENMARNRRTEFIILDQ
jgi:outer membrane protein OmpA-like peptidoglycan-associated protein